MFNSVQRGKKIKLLKPNLNVHAIAKNRNDYFFYT